jgi:FMN reductase
MSLIAIVAGTRLVDSPTRSLAEFVAQQLNDDGHETFVVDMSTIPPGVLIDGATVHASVNDLVATVDSADGLIVVASVVKHAYSATAKLMVELLPESAVRSKPVLILSTGDTPPTRLPSDLDAALAAMGAQQIVPAVNVSNYDITRHACTTALEEQAELAVQQSLSELLRPLRDVGPDRTTGLESAVVSADEALAAFRTGSVLLDVRRDPAEGVGFISGAIYVRKDDIDAVFSPARQPEVRGVEAVPIVVFCNSEHGSRSTVDDLTRLGYRSVTHVRGGARAIRQALIHQETASMSAIRHRR